MINLKNFNWVHRKKKGMKNDEQDENSPVEIKNLNERTSSKDLKQMQSKNTNLQNILSTPE